MIVVDSCGWLEYFSAGPLADEYYSYLKDPARVIVPTIAIYEVYKKIKREAGEEKALLAVAQMQTSNIASFANGVVLLAADLSLAYNLPMADAIVYATAKINNAKLVTSDEHFTGLESVVFIA
ncbi:MAG: type II toxin-antitoxin system VapC family toxin [Candidatus Saganbacteria bacterium]|nr:type II toxin-antitoxin system VapC family toxin [Candidatus Saganbacteria bacterium]